MNYKRRQLSAEEKEFVLKRDHYRCQKCNLNLLRDSDNRRFDHKLPISKGGDNSLENFQLLCSRCDEEKGDTIPETQMDQYIKRRLEILHEESEIRKKRFFKR